MKIIHCDKEMGLETEEDAVLLKAIEQGSHNAFAVLVRRHHERFYAAAYRFVGNRQEAEDIVQGVFLKLWEYPGKWDPGKGVKFTTWFYRIIVNSCIDAQKKKKPLSLPEGAEIVDTRATQEVILATRQKRRMLEQAIASLPIRQQAALNLCLYEGVSNQEAATVMEINVKALESLLSRAKQTLKDIIAGQLW